MNEITFRNMIQKVRKRIHVIELFMNVRLSFILYKRFYERYTYRGIDDTDPNITEFYFRTGYYQSRNALAIREITKRENGKVCKICYLSVKNPTKTFLRELYNIIKNEIESDSKLSKLHKNTPSNACCVHCVESALDFFPNDVKDIEYIFDYLISGMCIRYGQEDEHQLHNEMTFYYGKRKEFVDSNTGKKRSRVYVNNHLHGVRVYYRPKKGKSKYIRFEFLANKDRLIRMKLRDLKSLSKISTESIRPMDHVVYRKKNVKIPSEYFRGFLEKQGTKISKLASNVIFHAVKDRLHGQNSDESFRRSLSINAGVDSYKKMKKKFGLKQHVDRFYPKDNDKINRLRELAGAL